MTSIGFSAFNNCSGLTSITIPNSVTSIGNWAFKDCSGLTSITIPNSVTSIGDEAFNKCSGLTSVTIGNSVTSIGNEAFFYCSGLTSVTIGNSVKSIGENAFRGCSSLTSITIPNSVTSIGDEAFYQCRGLTSITIGNSVTSLGLDVFSCGQSSPCPLVRIYSLSELPAKMYSNHIIRDEYDSFCDHAYKNAILYVPNTNHAILFYQAAERWNKFEHIEAIDMTGIDSPTITQLPSERNYYNLQGQRTTNANRGLNIVNGKKIITQ